MEKVLEEKKGKGSKSDKSQPVSSPSAEAAPAKDVGSPSESPGSDDFLSDLLNKQLKVPSKGKPELEELSLLGVASYLQADACANVIVMVGAGISTAAGIPDFRSPGTGIYSTLYKYDLPNPESMFDIQYFRIDPEPFFKFAKSMFPSQLKPTLCHYFCKLLNDKGKLLRLYTQNIDGLERISGIPSDKVVEAHGTFFTSHCMNRKCRQQYDLEWMREKIFADIVPRCSLCAGVAKPDIVFFGENLPERFHSLMREDFRKCDLLIVIGTSLTVEPFAGLVGMVPRWIPRLLINNKKCGQANVYARLMGSCSGFDFDSESNKRDVFWLGLADDGCKALAEALGWKEELQSIFTSEHARLDQLLKSDTALPPTGKGCSIGPS